jgi:LVIVD repeat
MLRLSRRAVVLLALALPLATAAPSLAGDRGAFDGQGMARTSAWAKAGDLPQPSPRAVCGPGSTPETGIQGRVPADAPDGGFNCNLQLIGREGKSGGFKVQRFVDKAGHECAYYDTTLLFPTNIQNLSDQPTGAAVLDMSDPAHPVRTETLLTPAMQTPHESLLLNEKRGLLVAVMGNPLFYPGVIDVYDVNDDCRHPALQSSLPVGLLGHESGFAPDGKTFYATSLATGNVTAVDLSNPKLPVIVWTGQYNSHGLTISEDGNRAYVAAFTGLIVLDVSEVQARKPNPQVREVSRLSWDTLTIPQVAVPVTIGGNPFLVEIDEFSTGSDGGQIPQANGSRVGAGRIIDISDEKAPKVVSDIRLEVNQPENRAQIAGDPGANSALQGYAGHYCSVPQRVEPGIVACSFIASGLRVFDIRDPYHPKELAYYTTPKGNPTASPGTASNYAMSSPAFVPERREIWYSDGNTGFYALRMAKGVWPFEAIPNPLPGAGRCVDRRKFGFQLHHGPDTRVVRVVVFVNGKLKLTRRGRDIRRVTLRRLPRGRFTLRIVSTHSNGSRLVSSRTYRGCKKGRPRTRGHHR